ncbi:glycosyltransferase family 2 protein [Flavobacterium sp. JAS]|uniref:glycosyltransferase family 2 protein n=1 Tax=Flavobacterium sp. JAS TaxID=2897329 RepID=UPI001E4D2423|nr:glycosyltransferase family 2 protein [Flavobacterium sp. JAS]MCD0470959.1 glycosyltransferase [Flavobacterium sp. JAS]
MKHTVVIPLYNKEAYIFDTIKSLAFQEKKAAQIIIVDDFSSDKSLINLKDSLSFFAPQFLQTDIQIIELKENKGPGNARNMGLELATGDVISFLDADDCYISSCLNDVNAIMEQEKIDVLILGIVLIPSNYYLPNIKSFEKELISLSNDLFLIPDPLHTVSAPDFIMGVGSNVVIQKTHLKNIRYETDVSLNEGIDFWYRVLKNVPQQSRVGLLNKASIEVREVEGSLSRISYSNWKELEIPVSIKRYYKSTNRYDQQLMGMLSQRWLSHAMKRLPSWKEKALFLFKHHRLLVKNSYYLKKRSK